MTITPPPLGIIDFGPYRDNFWGYRGLASSVYTPGMTEPELLDAIRRWIDAVLVPNLKTNFSTLEVSWETQVESLVSRVDASIAEALTAIANADIPITDPVVYAVLITADSQVRTWLDAHYVSRATGTKSALTGSYHVDDFGAKGDGTSRDEVAIQAAIDAAHADYLLTQVVQRVKFNSKVYRVGAVNYLRSNGTVFGITSLLLKDGVELCGPGTIKTIDGAYGNGALYSVVRSPDTGLSNAGIRDLTIISNRTGNVASPQCGGVQLEALDNVWVKGCSVFDSNGNAVMVKGTTTRFATNIRIEDNEVSGTAYIGIQSSHFNGLSIINNHISWTSDNAIDVYGEDGSTTAHGINFTINGNRIHDCGNGIFLETVAIGECVGNRIRSVGEGFHVNRINGQPAEILIAANHIRNSDKGIALTGDSGGVTIRNNEIEAFNTGGVVLGGAGNVSHYYILDNTMNGNSDTSPKVLIRAGTNQVANIIHLRTITRSKNRTFDTVNSGPTAVSSTWAYGMSPGDTPA